MNDTITLPRATVQQVLEAIDLYQRNEHCEDELLIAGHFLRTALEQQQAEPVASIYVSLDGAREFDDWKHELPVGRNFLYTAALQRKPLTDAEFCEQWLKQTGRIMGTDKQLLLQAKQVTEAAHGIKENT